VLIFWGECIYKKEPRKKAYKTVAKNKAIFGGGKRWWFSCNQKGFPQYTEKVPYNPEGR
jgi:hypothetical protein